MLAILRLRPNSVVIMAPVCSGFSFMCSSQSARYFWCPLGDETKPWVKASNVMSVRVTLLCWLLAALGHTFVLEQPGSAKFGDMPRWQFFCQKICYDFQLQYAVSSCLQELGNLVLFWVCAKGLSNAWPRFSGRRPSCATMAGSLSSLRACGAIVGAYKRSIRVH